jgi:tetratricopeptide (TPR) repeat protein
MSGNYTEETRPLWRLLKQEGFQFVVVFINHGRIIQLLQDDIAARFSDQPLQVLDAANLDYETFMGEYRRFEKGILLLENFEQVLSRFYRVQEKEIGEKESEEKRKKGLLAGMNLRRDLLMESPITLILTVGPYGVVKKARPLMDAMPDLWSVRSLVLDLKVKVGAGEFEDWVATRHARIFEPSGETISTLGGGTEQGKLAEITRLEEAFRQLEGASATRQLTILEQLIQLYRDVSQPEKVQAYRQLRNALAHGVNVPTVSGKNIVMDSQLHAGGNIHVVDMAMGDKIERQINQGAGGTYIENQTVHHVRDRQARILTNSPAQPSTFEGRTEDLDRIRTILNTAGASVVLLHAEGGMGKTSLAAHYWAKFAKDYKNMAWLYVQDQAEVFLLGLERELDLARDPKADADTRLHNLLAALGNLGAPSLLVLDDLNDEGQLSRMVARLSTLNNFHVLITSRCEPLQGQKSLKVLPLKEDLALEVMKKNYPAFQERERHYFHQVYRAIGGNTLVIELFGKMLGRLNRYEVQYPLDQLVADLQDGGLFSIRSTEVTTLAGASQEYEKADVLTVIRELYGSKRMRQILDTHGQFLLSNLALLPSDGGSSVLLKKLIVELHDSSFDFEDSLDDLCAIGWVEFDPTSRSITMSPVVQEIIRERQSERLLADSLGLVASLKEGIGRGIGTVQMTDFAFAEIRRLVSYGESVCHYLREKADLEIARLNEGLARYYFDVGDLDAAQRAAERMVMTGETARKAQPTDPNPIDMLATGTDMLGRIAFDQGKLHEAINRFTESKFYNEVLVKNLPDIRAYQVGVAISQMHMGEVFYLMRNYDVALRWFQDSLHTRKKIMGSPGAGLSEKAGLAVSSEKLGDVYVRTGDYSNALKYYREELSLYQELSDAIPSNLDFQTGMGSAFFRLGDALFQLDQFGCAMIHFGVFNQYMGRIVEANPYNLDSQAGFALSFLKVGAMLSEKVERKAVALEKVRQAVSMLQEVVGKAPSVMRYRLNLEDGKRLLHKLVSRQP